VSLRRFDDEAVLWRYALEDRLQSGRGGRPGKWW